MLVLNLLPTTNILYIYAYAMWMQVPMPTRRGCYSNLASVPGAKRELLTSCIISLSSPHFFHFIQARILCPEMVSPITNMHLSTSVNMIKKSPTDIPRGSLPSDTRCCQGDNASRFDRWKINTGRHDVRVHWVVEKAVSL